MRLLPLLLLSGCTAFGELYHITPARDTATITRVFGTSQEIADFCETITKARNPACAMMAGNRTVLFLPHDLPAVLSGHELEHAFSGTWHP